MKTKHIFTLMASLSLFIGLGIAHADEVKSGCATTEKELFNCKIGNAQLSLCKGDNNVGYRFLNASDNDLSIRLDDGVLQKTYNDTRYVFSNGTYQYSVFSVSNVSKNKKLKSGVIVKKGNKIIKTLECDKSSSIISPTAKTTSRIL